jgi:fatty-acyl-CoA synthase
VKVALTPLDFLERARRLFGPLEAVVDTPRRLTYGEFAGRAHRLGHAVRTLTAEDRHARVAFLCPNTVELLESYYGVLLAGSVLTPLNIRLTRHELQRCVDDCRATVLFVHPSLADRAPDVQRVVTIGDEYESMLRRQPADDCVPPPVDEDDVCEIFYTSGSTGDPKGVMLTHRNLYLHAVHSALTMGAGHRDTVLHTIPLFHVNGWGTPHWVTALGGRHVMLSKFEPALVLALIARQRITRLHLVPTMALALLEHDAARDTDFSSLTQVTVGGAPAGASLLAALEDVFGCEVVQGYGMTETAPQLTKAFATRAYDNADDADRRRVRATTGHPNIGVDLRVFDEHDNEVARDGHTVGEICVRSNHVMAGYWERPDESAAAMRGGWLRTGDLATVDAAGYVTIVDRRKDLIVSGGENISSVEVERAIEAHPAVLEAAVVGMADTRWGEVPRAFVVPRAEHAVDVDELVAFVRERLAGFKVPRRVDIVDALPRTGTGKIQKTTLREVPITDAKT